MHNSLYRITTKNSFQSLNDSSKNSHIFLLQKQVKYFSQLLLFSLTYIFHLRARNLIMINTFSLIKYDYFYSFIYEVTQSIVRQHFYDNVLILKYFWKSIRVFESFIRNIQTKPLQPYPFHLQKSIFLQFERP